MKNMKDTKGEVRGPRPWLRFMNFMPSMVNAFRF